MKSIELLIVLMALSSSSATASPDNQARADMNQPPPAKAAPVKVVARAAPTGKTSVSVYKPSGGARKHQSTSAITPGDKLASTTKTTTGFVDPPGF